MPKKYKRNYLTEKIENDICYFYLSGYSKNEIFKKLNISIADINKTLKKFEIKTKYFISDEKKEKIIDLYQKGYSSIKIAKLLDISKQPVLNILNKNKLIRERNHPKEFYDQFKFENNKWVGKWKCKVCNNFIEFYVNEKSLIYRNLKRKKVCKKCSLLIQNKKPNYHSKAELEIFNYIKNKNISVFMSYMIDKKIYDFYLPDYNLLIEYNGTYWHCDPRFYSPDFKHKKKGIIAKDIWRKDKEKLDLAIKNKYNYEVIWESDYKNNKIIIDKILNKWRKKI